MAQAAPKHRDAPHVAPAFGRVAAGGPIADLQRTLEQRLVGEHHVDSAVAEDGIASRISRVTGPALLAVAYGGVALWWF